jgi:hypothetical protein
MLIGVVEGREEASKSEASQHGCKVPTTAKEGATPIAIQLLPTLTAPDSSRSHTPTTQTTSPLNPQGDTPHTMSLLRTSRILSSARGQLQIVPRLAASPTLQQQRQISSTPARKGGDAHGDPYDPPTGWLFGVKPGEKAEKEGWENVFYYGFFGSMAFGVVGYWFKPDTRYVMLFGSTAVV